METLNIDKVTTKTKEQVIYFHPILTTLTFIVTLPYYLAFCYLSYNSWMNNKIGLFVLYITTFILLTPSFLKILKAFVRLILNKPGIRLTKFRLYDYLNNIDLRWADIKQLSPFDLRWWSYLSVENLSEPILPKQSKNPLTYLFLLKKMFIKRRRILKINLFLLKGKNTDILAIIKLYSEAK